MAVWAASMRCWETAEVAAGEEVGFPAVVGADVGRGVEAAVAGVAVGTGVGWVDVSQATRARQMRAAARSVNSGVVWDLMVFSLWGLWWVWSEAQWR